MYRRVIGPRGSLYSPRVETAPHHRTPHAFIYSNEKSGTDRHPGRAQSLARAKGIPTRFLIGFPLAKGGGKSPGYHCWSDFYIDGQGWIPVDISEAWKHPEKRDYFFGAHDVNRMQFSMGRDLRLNPPQEGAALNYFVYPYVEVDGREHPNVSLAFSFADAGTAVAAGQ